MFNNREKVFRETIRRVSHTADGRMLFKILTEDLVKLDLFDDNPNLVYFNLGRRELLLSLLHAAEVDFKDIKVSFTDPQEETSNV